MVVMMSGSSPSPSSHLPSKSVYVGSRIGDVYYPKLEEDEMATCSGLGEFKSEWYSLSLSAFDNDDKPGDRRSLTPTKPIPEFSNFVAIDSTIYCLGGSEARASKKVFCLDTTLRPPEHEQSQSWVEGSPMNICRTYPHAVVLHKKIYVMGGIDDNVVKPDSKADVWAEIFDAKSGMWLPLSPPPTVPTECGMFSAALPALDRILVGSEMDYIMYSYHVKGNYWELWDSYLPPGGRLAINKPLAVGTALFWLCGFKLYAYDFVKKWFASCNIPCMDELVTIGYYDRSNFPLLLHIDDSCRFCLVFYNLTHLHCKVFSVTRNETSLNTVVQSFQAFNMKGSPIDLHAVVLVDRGDAVTEVIRPQKKQRL